MYVDADTIESLVTEYYKMITKCLRTFADMPKVQHVANIIKVSYENNIITVLPHWRILGLGLIDNPEAAAVFGEGIYWAQSCFSNTRNN